MLFQNFHNGINLGGWLSQYEFLARRPLTKDNLQAHFQSFITEADLRQIASWNFDHVRLPISGYLLFDRNTRKLNPEPLEYIDQCIIWCTKYHLNIILYLHDLWGNVYGAMDTPMPLLTDSNLQDNFLTIWAEMADHFKQQNEPVIMFELLNEVSDGSHYLWNHLYKQTIKTIRAIDPDRYLLIGSNGQNHAAYLKELDLSDDPAVFYNFHYYDPQVFTHQKAHFSDEMKEFNQTITYPGDISAFPQYLKKHPEYLMKYALVANETVNDRVLMDRLLKDALDFVKYSGCQLYCGEFGVIDSAPVSEAIKWMTDFLSILNSHSIGHALWNYKALDFGLMDLDGKVRSEELLQFIIKSN
ncbi:MAG: glycoside hydrolase family 5 protein [Oliverpabstia sp.]